MAFHHFICYKEMYKSLCVYEAHLRSACQMDWLWIIVIIYGINEDSFRESIGVNIVSFEIPNYIPNDIQAAIVFVISWRACMRQRQAAARMITWILNKMRMNGLFALSVKFILGHMLWKCVPGRWPRPERVRLRVFRALNAISFAASLICLHR